MDYETLSAMGVSIGWIGDILRLADIKPRHIGRVVTFVYWQDNRDQTDPQNVIGTLEGASGEKVIVSGDEYEYAGMGDFKVWRRAVKND